MAQQHSRFQAESLPDLSIIIPALNEADELDATLHAIARLRGHKEVIVVDGGSQDMTAEIARQHGACVMREQGGRGRQLHAGASLAKADILWFLHADTIPPANAVEHIKEALQGPDIVGGCFAVTFAGSTSSARFLTWLFRRLHKVGLCYGDAAIFVKRHHYTTMGGFPPFPIFEDVALLQSLKAMGRLVECPATVTTSSRRIERCGLVRTLGLWTALQVLYWLGVSPYTLGRFYRPVKGQVQTPP